MITVGTKVCITDFTDFLLQKGNVKKITKGKAIVKFPGKPGKFEYNLEDLEEVQPSSSEKGK
jgi:hypothetical protein